MTNIVAKFYKVDKYNKNVFIVSNEIDEPSFKYITLLFKKLSTLKFKNNPIYHKVKKNNDETFFLTINNKTESLEYLRRYSFQMELRVYKEQYINLFMVSKPKIMKTEYQKITIDDL